MDISVEAHSRLPPVHVSLLKASQPGPYSLASDPRKDTLYLVGADGVLRSFETLLHRPDAIDAVPLSPAQIQAHIDFLTSQSSRASDAENQNLESARARLEKLFDGVDGTKTTDHDLLMHGHKLKRSEAFDREIFALNLQCRRLHQTISARSGTTVAEPMTFGGPAQFGVMECSRRRRANSYYSMEGR